MDVPGVRETHIGERPSPSPSRSSYVKHSPQPREWSEVMTGTQSGVGRDMTQQGWPAKPTKITELTAPMTWPLHAKDTPCPVCGEQIEQLNGRRQAVGVNLPEWDVDPCGDRWVGKAIFDTEHGTLMWEALGQITD